MVNDSSLVFFIVLDIVPKCYNVWHGAAGSLSRFPHHLKLSFSLTKEVGRYHAAQESSGDGSSPSSNGRIR